MKIAIIADTHFGIRNDSEAFLKNQEKFWNEIFFPTIKKQEIKDIIHLGDFFDRRKYINFKTFDKCQEVFLDPLRVSGATMVLILGNHDVYHKSSNEINGPELLLRNWKDIQIIDRPIDDIFFGSLNIGFVPWMCPENEEECLKFLKETDADFICGHFDIIGFEQIRGHVNESHGLEKKVFKRFEKVFSGHYHHPSKKGNIEYLGATSQYDWNDYGGKRGFHILDTDTLELEFVENPYQMFYRIEYTDDTEIPKDIEKYKDAVVKVVVKSSEDKLRLEQFRKKLENVEPFDYSLVSQSVESFDIDEDVYDESKDTISIMFDYVDASELSKKEETKEFLKEIYLEASDRLS